MTVEMADTIAALRAWCAAGTGIEQVRLENAPLDRDEAVYVVVRIVDDRDEELSVQKDERNDRVLPRVDVIAKMTVQIGVVSDSQDPDQFALGYLRRLRAFSKIDRMREILAEGWLVLVSLDITTNEDEQDDDERWISRFVLLATFRNRYVATGDFTLDAKSWIEKVNGTGTLEGTDIAPTLTVDIHPED